ncbi:MAG: hypothetical protein P1U88_17860 [Thalassobaculaceae bacterium]|nr:hypothetical protein [Thalassobaculaceae bacterium]
MPIIVIISSQQAAGLPAFDPALLERGDFCQSGFLQWFSKHTDYHLTRHTATLSGASEDVKQLGSYMINFAVVPSGAGIGSKSR